MNENDDELLRIQLTGISSAINADAFVEVFQNVLIALKEINRQVSEYGSESVEWEIVSAGLNSPMYATLRGSTKDRRKDANNSISAYVSGMRHLEESNTPPKYFTERALRATADLRKAESRGVADVQVSSKGIEAHADRRLEENAIFATRTLEHMRIAGSAVYRDYGTIEGMLTDLAGRKYSDSIIILDDLTKSAIRCYFKDNKLEQRVRLWWKRRVGVTGYITYTHGSTGPSRVDVEDIYVFLDDSELPDLDELPEIDITGGIESSEYVRMLRDGYET